MLIDGINVLLPELEYKTPQSRSHRDKINSNADIPLI